MSWSIISTNGNIDTDSLAPVFQLNSTYIGLNVAIVNVGNVVSGPLTGPLMDRVGRKRALLLGNALQVTAIVLQVAAVNGESSDCIDLLGEARVLTFLHQRGCSWEPAAFSALP